MSDNTWVYNGASDAASQIMRCEETEGNKAQSCRWSSCV